ncbi:MAG: citrate (Si)-synthase, partial [Planctomycetota bacterium]
MPEPAPKSATLRYGDASVELPVLTGTEGERALDISNLRAKTGLITLDPGLGNTGSCQSAITFIDGERG